MAYLPWISDDDIQSAVIHLLRKAEEAQESSRSEFGKNVIDPFAAMFEIAGFHLNYEQWVRSETNRQAQKTLQNHIGDFHQKILGSVKGWKNLKTGSIVDLVSNDENVIAEIKNKYNTISGGKLADLYKSLSDQVMPKNSIYKDYTAFYVAIIPKNPERYNIPFTPSDKGNGEKCASNKLIREIDGFSFYELVTKEKNALEALFNVLPAIIHRCSKGKYTISDIEKLKGFFSSAYNP